MGVDLLEKGSGSIPHSRWRLPVVGDVIGSNLNSPLHDAMRRGRDLGPIFDRKLFDRQVTMVWGADLVAELSDERRFTKYLSASVDRLRDLVGDGLFTAYNDEPNWRTAHDLLRPAFTQSAMRSYHSIMVDVAGDLVRHWDSRTDAPVDVAADMTKLTLETIGRTGFSHPFGSFARDRPHPFVEAMVGALRHTQRRAYLSPPVIGDQLWRRADERNTERIAYINKVVDDVIRQRVTDGHTGPDDLLELMLRAAREEDPNSLDERNIRYQIITFLIAGHETTSGALSFALHYLATNPDVLAAARAEVDDVWGRAETPTFEQIAKLRYVRRVLDESMRLWPTAPVYGRQAKADTTIGSRYPLATGEGVLILIPLLHRDPEVWGADVESFDPDRFLPEQVKARPAHVYKPFGTGERACIGRQFALHEAVLVLGTILQRYDIAGEPDYQLSIQERMTVMPRDFRMTVSRRP